MKLAFSFKCLHWPHFLHLQVGESFKRSHSVGFILKRMRISSMKVSHFKKSFFYITNTRKEGKVSFLPQSENRFGEDGLFTFLFLCHSGESSYRDMFLIVRMCAQWNFLPVLPEITFHYLIFDTLVITVKWHCLSLINRPYLIKMIWLQTGSDFLFSEWDASGELQLSRSVPKCKSWYRNSMFPSVYVKHRQDFCSDTRKPVADVSYGQTQNLHGKSQMVTGVLR